MSASRPVSKGVRLGVVGLLASAILLPQILAGLWDEYRWTGNYLSELGAVGAPYATITNLLGFLPVALLSFGLVLHLIMSRGLRGPARLGAILLIIGFSSGYLLAVLFPCDFGCPVEGSPRQAIHNLGGLIQYPLGALGLILLGRYLSAAPMLLRGFCLFAGGAMALGFVMMVMPEQAAYRGAWQRLGDYCAVIVICMLVLSGPWVSRR